jgi:hypothetical protein
VTVTAPPRPPKPRDPVEHEDLDARALEALIEEARQRTRRRRRRYAAVAVLLAATGVSLSIVLARPGPSQDASAASPPPGAALEPDGGPPRAHTHAVTAGGPGLVAVGAYDAFDDKADIWTSSDGRTWRRVPGTQLGPGVINDVTTGGPGLVAVGNGNAGRFQGAVWTSRDGLIWSREPNDPIFDGTSIAAIGAGGPGLVAVGNRNHAWFSSDGLTWERASVPTVPTDVYPGDNGRTPQVYMTDVAAAGDRLVAVGWAMMSDNSEQVVAWTSADGMTWTGVPLDPEVFPDSSSFKSVTGGPDGFTIAGDRIINGQHEGDEMWTSADGLRWRRG